MNWSSSGKTLGRLAVIAAMTILAIPNLFAQHVPSLSEVQAINKRTQDQQTLQQIMTDKVRYAMTILQKWEPTARTGGRWNDTAASDLLNALMKLEPENLLAAGDATSYKGMLDVLPQ